MNTQVKNDYAANALKEARKAINGVLIVERELYADFISPYSSPEAREWAKVGLDDIERQKDLLMSLLS